MDDYLTTNYALACNGILLPNSAQIKKLRLERTDILVLVHGVTSVRLNENSSGSVVFPPVRFRQNPRLSLSSTDSRYSSIMNDNLFQEVEDLRQELDNLRKECCGSIHDSSKSNESEAVSGSVRKEISVLRQKMVSSENSTQGVISEFRNNVAQFDAEMKRVKTDLENLTKSFTSKATSFNQSSFNELRLNTLQTYVTELQNAVGATSGSATNSLASQLTGLSTRVQSIQRDCGNMRVAIEDLEDRLDELPEGGVVKESVPEAKRESASESLLGLYDTITENQQIMEDKIKARDEEFDKRLKPLEESVESLAGQVDAFKTADSLTKGKIVQMDARVKSVEEAVKSVEEEKEELSRVVKTSQFAVNDVKKNVNELRASLEETKRSVNGLRGSVEETKKGASDDALAEGVAALKVSVEENKRAIAESKSSGEELKKSVSEMQMTVSRCEKNMGELRVIVEENEKSVDTLILAQNDVKKSVNEVKRDVEESKRSVAECKKGAADSKKSVGDLRSIVEESARIMSELSLSHDETKKSVEELKKSVEEKDGKGVEESVGELKKEVGELKVSVDEMNSSLITTKEEVSSLQDTSSLLQDTTSASSSQLNLLSKQCDDLNKKSSSLETSILRLMTNNSNDESVSKSVVMEMNDRMSGLKTEIDETKKDMNELKLELDKNKKDVSELKRGAEDAKKSGDETKKSLNELKNGLAESRKSVEDSKKSVNELKVVIVECKKSVAESQKDVAALKSGFEESQKDVTALKNNMTENGKRLNALQSDVEREGATTQSLAEANAAASQSIASLSDSLQQCHSMLADTTNSIQQLKDIVTSTTTPARDAEYDDTLLNSKLTEVKLKVAILESRLQSLRPSLQAIPALQADVHTLQSSFDTMHKDVEDVLIKQGTISSQMSTLSEDWDSRQQTVLKEFTLVKTQFDDMVSGSGGSRGKGLFRASKNNDDVAASLEVLREDEKGLKERVVLNSEVCSDRFVRLSQQIENLKVMVTQLQRDVEARGENQDMKVNGIISDLREEMEQMRVVGLEGSIGKVSCIKKKENEEEVYYACLLHTEPSCHYRTTGTRAVTIV